MCVCVCVCVCVRERERERERAPERAPAVTVPNAVACFPHSVTNLGYISDCAMKCALRPL